MLRIKNKKGKIIFEGDLGLDCLGVKFKSHPASDKWIDLDLHVVSLAELSRCRTELLKKVLGSLHPYDRKDIHWVITAEWRTGRLSTASHKKLIRALNYEVRLKKPALRLVKGIYKVTTGGVRD